MKKIGLLTPYTGDNFGDGAIQDAVLLNIKSRDAQCQIYGFTLDPKETEVRHQIPCFPITALPVHYYASPKISLGQEVNASAKEPAGFASRIKNMLKQNWLFNKLIAPPYKAIKFVRWVPDEIKLISKSYALIKECDLLLVSGGGQIDDYWGGPWGHPFALFKWGLIAKWSKTPYVFLSVGTCTLASKLSRFFIRHALNLASYRSYRDHKSKTLLQEYKITHGDPVYPDLAFSYKVDEKKSDGSNRKSTFTIGISPIPYLAPDLWPEQDQMIYRQYLTTLASFMSHLTEQGHSVVLFRGDTGDSDVINELEDVFRNANQASHKDKFRIAQIDHVKDLLNLLGQVDFVVASRLHGVILSHLMNRPVIAISYDRKVNTHMENMAQTRYCVEFNRIDLALLKQKLHSLISNKEQIKSELGEKAHQYEIALGEQYDRVFNAYSINDGSR